MDKKEKTSFESIFKRFLSKISDYDIFLVSQDLSSEGDSQLEKRAEYVCLSLLTSALAQLVYIPQQYKEIADDKSFNTALPAEIQEIIALKMVMLWVEPQLNNTLLTSQYFGTKDEKFYSQANHIEQLRELRDDCEVKTQKLVRDIQYANM